MKRSLLIAGCILCLIVAFLAAMAHHLRHNITPAAAAQIRVGMTMPEVEAILAGPPGRYYRWYETELALIFHPAGRQWIADDFAVIVSFDSANRVTMVHTMDGADLIRNQRGFFIDGENMIPESVRTWLGGDFARPPRGPLLLL